ncbi:hypothetical protein D3C84_857820 [compost metagenome]
MLLTGLQCHSQCFVSCCIERNANNTPGKYPFIFLPAGKECGMGASVAHRNPKALRIPNNTVRTPFPGRN